MNHKSILFFLGINFLCVSFFSILNIIYSIYFSFFLDIDSYIVTLIISFIIGFVFCFIYRKESKNINLSDQIIFILLSFIFLPLLISIPYYLSIYNFNFINAYFEAVSGFTTTGFTIIENIKNIDESLLIWRSSSQWLGGLFFLVATIGTIGSSKIKIKPSYLVSGGTSDQNFYKNFNYNSIKILMIYFFTTVLFIFLYSFSGIRLFDGFNLALTIVSSGGFITTAELSSVITNNLQIFILSLTLLIPIFNFYLFFNLFSRKFSFQNHQEDIHLGIMILLLTLFFYFFLIAEEGFLEVFLAVVTSISTSGISLYSSTFDISLFFILLTIIGGSLISTSSGLKYIRFYILFKISYQEIYRLVKPINIFNKNLFNTESKIGDDDSKIAFLVFILFIISLFVLSSILTLDNLTFENAFKLSMLTLTNTVTSSLYGLDNISFFDLNSITKISLIFFMIFGKIEIIAILFLIKKFVFKE
tara:strand:- start:435 stop:1856 length:1422 start_codon:yes stop_codon:yes gene_type:complete